MRASVRIRVQHVLVAGHYFYNVLDGGMLTNNEPMPWLAAQKKANRIAVRWRSVNTLVS